MTNTPPKQQQHGGRGRTAKTQLELLFFSEPMRCPLVVGDEGGVGGAPLFAVQRQYRSHDQYTGGNGTYQRKPK